jgi:hypothetical protein
VGWPGALFYGAVCLSLTALAVRLLRVAAAHSERHLTDVTALRFVVQLLQGFCQISRQTGFLGWDMKPSPPRIASKNGGL